MNRPEALRACLESLAAQTVPPTEVVLVHAGSEERLGERLGQDFAGAPFALHYVRSRPSLVHQRNLGIERSRGEVVFFFDDDVVLEPDYLECVIAAYAADASGHVAGVQGSITNAPSLPKGGLWVRRIFLLTRTGKHGYLQRSGFPCFSAAVQRPTTVEVFSGCMMSFRRTWLDRYRFDETLERYWAGDDWDLSYRISREARLMQLPDARLAHNQADPGRDSLRRVWRMMVVNHRYLYIKHLRAAGQSWLPWFWAETGLLLLAVLRMLAGRGSEALTGVLEGFHELRQTRHQSHPDKQSATGVG